MSDENWRGIAGYPNYSVSDHGRVMNSVTGKILKANVSGPGYLAVALCPGPRTSAVHRLVAAAFVSRPDDATCVNHINHDRQDNRAVNLEWVTQRGNINHAVLHGRMASGERHGQSKLTADAVREIRSRLAAGETGRALAKAFGVCPHTISSIKRRAHWKSAV